MSFEPFSLFCVHLHVKAFANGMLLNIYCRNLELLNHFAINVTCVPQREIHVSLRSGLFPNPLLLRNKTYLN